MIRTFNSHKLFRVALLQMMNEMDVDGGGSVEFDEFAVVMAKKLPRLRT